MKVKVRSYFTISNTESGTSLSGTSPTIRLHNTLSAEYEYLLQGLLTQGQSYKAPYSGYTVAFSPPSSMYFVLVNNGVVVARLPAKVLSYNEDINTVQCQNNLVSCNLNDLSFSLEYGATDETNGTYTFDEVQLWADNEYMVAYAIVGTTTKTTNTFIRVTWDAVVSIESGNVLYMPGCTNFSLTSNLQLQLNNYQSYLCLNLPYIIVALTLIPYTLIPQNTFLYTQLSALLQALNINPNVSPTGTPPTQQLQLQGIQYYVVSSANVNVVYPISQPYIVINTGGGTGISSTQQSSTISLLLLYGINNNYFIYTTPISVSIQYFKLYIPTLTINVVEQ